MKISDMNRSLYSKVTSKGQITIPAVIRDRLGLIVGNKMEFLDKVDYVIMLPLNRSVQSLKGILSKPDKALSLEEMNQIIRNRT